MSIYGLLISFGIFIALVVAERLAQYKKYDVDVLWGYSLWVIISGVVGARLYYVVSEWHYFAQNPLSAFSLRTGGLSIFGALVGGLIAMRIYFKKVRHPMIKWLDLTAVVIPLAQSIGRFGNFFNKELYGSPTRLPWGMYIPLEYRPDTYINNDVFHPLFIYESISNILLFSLLFLLFKGKNVLGIKKWYLRDEGSGPLPDGFFVGLYFIGYGIIRFLIEFLKIDIWWFFGLNMAQVICFGFILGGFWWLKKIKKS